MKSLLIISWRQIDYGGIHSGEVFEFCLNDVWVQARVEMADDWYLVGLPGLKLDGLEVKRLTDIRKI